MSFSPAVEAVQVCVDTVMTVLAEFFRIPTVLVRVAELAELAEFVYESRLSVCVRVHALSWQNFPTTFFFFQIV